MVQKNLNAPRHRFLTGDDAVGPRLRPHFLHQCVMEVQGNQGKKIIKFKLSFSLNVHILSNSPHTPDLLR